MSSTLLLVAFCAAAISSFYGSVVAGHGLVLIPVLMLLGMEPQVAIATAIVGYMGMSLIGIILYNRAGKLDTARILPFLLLSMLGAAAGPFFLLQVDPVFLRKGIGVLLLILCCLVPWMHRTAPVPPRRAYVYWGYVLAVPFGFYATTLALGSSFFLTFIFLFLFGQSYLQGAASRNVIFAGCNGIAIAGFVIQHVIDWPVAMVLFLGNMLGTFGGVLFAVRADGRWIQPVFLLIVLVSALQLLLGR